MRPAAVAVLLLLCCTAAAGCRRGQPLLRDNAPPATAVRTSPDGTPSYIGRWATAPTACGHAAWALSATEFQSPGALHCSISQVSPTSAGFTVNAACSSGGAPTPGRIVLTMVGAAPARSMSMSGGPFAEPVSLIRCPASQP